ncbi:MAG: glutamyl-tRNA reductase, partial [Pricia sp.]|nr:glutamyl-tRNA reductase [Pricia sp.]
MKDYHISRHNSFYTIGLSYLKADADVRGKFSLDADAMERLLLRAREQGIDGLLVTSTCNRTELHGFAQHPFQLIKLLCDNTTGTIEEFQEFAYVYKNNDAISHLF